MPLAAPIYGLFNASGKGGQLKFSNRGGFVMKKFFWAISVFFITMNTYASHLNFEHRVYEALEKINKAVQDHNLSFYYEAAQILRMAAVLSKNPQSKTHLEAAIASITDVTPDFKNPNQLVLTAKSQIQLALVAHHDGVSLNLNGEEHFVKTLIKSHFFPELNPKDINIEFQGPSGFTEKLGLTLLMSYIVDPQSIKYDDQICQLLTDKDLNGDPSTLSVSFNNGVLARTASREEAKGIRDLMNALLEQNRPEHGLVPLKMKYRIHDNEYELYFEAWGHKGIPYLRAAQSTFAFWANEATTYHILRRLEDFSFYLSHVNVPFDAPFLKPALWGASKTVDMVKAGLVQRRKISEESYNRVFATNTGEKIIERYEQKLDAAIKYYQETLAEFQKNLSGVSPAPAVPQSTAASTLAKVLPKEVLAPIYGDTDSGERRLISREEALKLQIAELEKEKRATIERMKTALDKFEAGGLELDLVKNEQGKWVKSSLNEVLSVAEYKEYLSQQMAEAQETQKAWGKMLQERVASAIGEAHRASARESKVAQIDYKEKLKGLTPVQAQQESPRLLKELDKKLKLIKEKYQLKIEGIRQKPPMSLWEQLQFKNLRSRLSRLQLDFSQAEIRAANRAANLRALPGHMLNSRKALIAAKASGPFWGKNSMHAWGADRGLLMLSSLMVGLHLIEWQLTYAKAESGEEKYLIWEDYGPKIWHMTAYCLPILQEAAFVLDLGHWGFNVARSGFTEYTHLNGTELALRELMHLGEWIGYKMKGTNEWEVTFQEFTTHYGLPSYKLVDDETIGRFYRSTHLNRFTADIEAYQNGQSVFYPREEEVADLSSTTKKSDWVLERRLDFIHELQMESRRYLGLIMELNYELKGKFKKEIQQWIVSSSEVLYGPTGQYQAARRAIEMSQKISQALDLELKKERATIIGPVHDENH